MSDPTPAPAMDLVPFDGSHAASVLGWARSPEERLAWASLAGDEADPSVFRRWHADPDVHPFMLLAGGELSGYGEIWEDADSGEAELARLIVPPDRRGRGVGRVLTTMLVERAIEAGLVVVWVRVVPTNAPALACYRGAGFVRASPQEEADFNHGQPREYVWMRLAARSADPGAG
jgi:ribosomal protein S18 acetylase RimI-like enzyme